MKFKAIFSKIATDLLLDFASFRTYLIIAAYAFNITVLYIIAFKGVDYKLGLGSIGLLTAVYAFYFKSKSDQAQMNVKVIPPNFHEDPDDN